MAEGRDLGAGKLAYRIDEAAAVLGVGRTKIYELIRNGDLEHGSFAGRSVIRREALEACMSRLFKPVSPSRGAV